MLLVLGATSDQAKAYVVDPSRAFLSSLSVLEIGAGYWPHLTQPVTWARHLEGGAPHESAVAYPPSAAR